MARTHALAIAGGLWAAWALLTALALRLPGEIVPVYLFGTVLLFAAAEVIHAPLSNALATAAAPDRHRGSYLAVFQYGFTVASLVVPAGFAWFFSTDPALPWLVIAALALVSSAAMLFLTGRLRAQAT